jgi:hypothetical protein
MERNEKAEAGSFRQKTDCTANAIEAFSTPNYSTSLEHVSSIIERIVSPAPTARAGTVHRLYICFLCGQCFPQGRMSSLLAICRGCLGRCREKGRIARRNEIDRVLNSIRIFLRGRLDSA